MTAQDGAADGSQPRGPWPQLRAAFVIFHVAAVLLGSVPAPEGGMRKAAWQDPTVKDELSAWAGRVRSVGLEVSDEDFQERLWDLAVGYSQLRESVLAPFQPYYRRLGVNQSWRMFIAPHRYPARLHIEVREGGAWRTVYTARSREATWRAHQLDHDRMRSAVFRYAWASYGRSWRQLSDWLALRAAEDFPDATAVRLRYFKQKSPSPAEVLSGQEPPGSWIRTRTLELAPLRAGATEPSADQDPPAPTPKALP